MMTVFLAGGYMQRNICVKYIISHEATVYPQDVFKTLSLRNFSDAILYLQTEI